jgi:hypothetical protein
VDLFHLQNSAAWCQCDREALVLGCSGLESARTVDSQRPDADDPAAIAAAVERAVRYMDQGHSVVVVVVVVAAAAAAVHILGLLVELAAIDSLAVAGEIAELVGEPVGLEQPVHIVAGKVEVVSEVVAAEIDSATESG